MENEHRPCPQGADGLVEGKRHIWKENRLGRQEAPRLGYRTHPKCCREIQRKARYLLRGGEISSRLWDVGQMWPDLNPGQVPQLTQKPALLLSSPILAKYFIFFYRHTAEAPGRESRAVN